MTANDSAHLAPSFQGSEEPVRPTYAPAAMAMGVAMMAWGLLTHWSMSFVGAALGAWALATWIREIATSWRN